MNMRRRLELLHEISLYMVVLVAFASIAAGSGAGVLMIAFFLVATLASWFVHRARVVKAAHARYWNVSVLLFLGYSVFDVATDPNADVILLGIRFVLVLLIIKLFSRLAPRDDLQIYALSLLTLAVATTVNVGVSYGILFGLYVLIGTFSMALFHLRSEVQLQPASIDHNRMPFDRVYVVVLASLSLMIFASSLGIFFLFPRMGLGFFTVQTRDNVETTGFSEQVELGGHGVLRDNPAVVLRIEFLSPRPQNYNAMRWRTMTFDTYDGRQWQRTQKESERPLRSDDGLFDLGALHASALRAVGEQTPGLSMQIYLEPIGTNLIPVVWPARTLHMAMAEAAVSWSPHSGGLTVDAYSDVRHTLESQIGMTYRLTTYAPPPEQMLATALGRTLSPELAEPFLQLPAALPQRTRDLAIAITEERETAFAKALAIQAHLKQNYTYTTDLPEVDPDDPLTSFLFEAQRGHCEYFATATVILLRASGVPARLVNGFMGGTWNDVGGYLTVRQGDAHSWAEVFVPEFGWVPIDSTPSSESAFSQRSRAFQWFNNTADAMRLTWMKWVIEYNLESQIALVRRVSRGLAPRGMGKNKERAADKTDTQSPLGAREILMWAGLLGLSLGAGAQARRRRLSARHALKVLLAVLWSSAGAGWMAWFMGTDTAWLLLGAAAPLASFITFGLVARPSRNEQSAQVSALFIKIEQLAGRRGLRRPPDEGPAFFLDRLASQWPGAARDLGFFKQRYLATRFGGRPISLEELAALKAAIGRIKKAMD
ncbi:MAG: DUF3488 domain-containing protein [Bradymonadaceae bacterium]|nr:DUF3488 domain-containing protein [Lujinxingiaceae bacterium]